MRKMNLQSKCFDWNLHNIHKHHIFQKQISVFSFLQFIATKFVRQQGYSTWLRKRDKINKKLNCLSKLLLTILTSNKRRPYVLCRESSSNHHFICIDVFCSNPGKSYNYFEHSSILYNKLFWVIFFMSITKPVSVKFKKKCICMRDN